MRWWQRSDDDFAREVQAHLDLETDRLVSEGMSPDEARHAARRRFGNVVAHKERFYEGRRLLWLDRARQDVRYAARSLLRTPGFTGVVVLTLALGIGANTAIFSVVDAVLLSPAPVEALDRLVMVWETDRHSDTTREPASWPDFIDFRDRSRQLQDFGAFMGREVSYTPAQDDAQRLAALGITHDLFPTLGLTPLVGRGFTQEETAAGGPPVVIVSEGFWTRALSRDPNVLGQTMQLDDRTTTIVGVMSSASDFGVFQMLSAAAYARSFADRGVRANVDIWLPLQASEDTFPRRTHPILVVGRLTTDASLVTAQEELGAIAADLERAFPENDGRGVFIEPLEAVVFGPIRPALLVLLGAVSLVLLVACVNVANLLLVRGAARRREVAVRTALGAGASRLVRQFLVESLLFTLAAAAAGVMVAQGGLRLLLQLAPAAIPRIDEATVDGQVLAVTLGVSMVVGLAFGLLPTFQARSVDLQSALKGDGGHGSAAGRGPQQFRSVLVVAELALAVILVVGAALLIKSFWHLQHVDPGFIAGGVMKAEYTLPASRYPVDFSRWPDFSEQHAFTREVLERARALPGVEAVAIGGNHPLDPGFTNSFTIVGREAEADTWPEIALRSVTPGYFETVGMPLRRGRLLREADGTFDPPVAVINEAAARRFFGDREPLGAEITLFGTARPVVGIVGNEHFYGLTEAPPLAVYLPLAQVPRPSGAGVLLARTAGDPTRLAGPLRAAIAEQDPGLAVFGVESLTETVSRSIAERRFTMLILGIFAVVALALAAIGIYGVVSYTVTNRTVELGIRMALGADAARVRKMVLRYAAVLTLPGILLGLLGAWIGSRWIESLLFGVEAGDPFTYASAVVTFLGGGLLSGWLPAERATRVDPVQTLSVE